MFNTHKYTPAGSTNIVHWQPWHGDPSHVPLQYPLNGGLVPYDETNPLILADQVAKMKLWGIDAINVDYYVDKPFIEKATALMLATCAANGLGFSICLDAGGENQAPPAPLTTTDEYIAALSLVGGEYVRNPAYLKDSQGRGFVNFFGEPAGIDWNRVRAALPVSLTLLFEGSQYSHAQADGCYGWVNPIIGDPTNINTASVKSFNDASAANPTKAAWNPVYPGFDDSLAGWSQKRVMSRGCGKTLRSTLALVPTTAKYVLIATWNDHEEGTGIEEGICVL